MTVAAMEVLELLRLQLQQAALPIVVLLIPEFAHLATDNQL